MECSYFHTANFRLVSLRSLQEIYWCFKYVVKIYELWHVLRAQVKSKLVEFSILCSKLMGAAYMYYMYVVITTST